MMVLHTDLDNTIIYSYKHDIGADKRDVEWYQGRQISFITNQTYRLLQRVKSEMLVVPTSTRTIEQYQRIDLGTGPFQYALVCNGGILLEDGKKDESWYRMSLEMTRKSSGEIKTAMEFLNKDKRRKFDLRLIEQLFVFTKCDQPDAVAADLKKCLNLNLVDVFCNGEKVYVVPVDLDKGRAVQRFRERVRADYVIAAGDSEFDVSMLKEADAGLAPYGFRKNYGIDFDVMESSANELFSEALLKECIRLKARRRQGISQSEIRFCPY